MQGLIGCLKLGLGFFFLLYAGSKGYNTCCMILWGSEGGGGLLVCAVLDNGHWEAGLCFIVQFVFSRYSMQIYHRNSEDLRYTSDGM